MVGLTHNTALVVIPPAESWPPIQAIREKHDRKIRRWMPHITLVYPFLPREQFDTARRFLADACGENPAFEIQLAAFNTFRHRRDNYTVWLRPEPEEPLVKLQAAQPLREPKFVCDVHLGKLARRLRLLGFDVAYHNMATDPELVETALAEQRTILTQDRGILKLKRVKTNSTPTWGCPTTRPRWSCSNFWVH